MMEPEPSDNKSAIEYPGLPAQGSPEFKYVISPSQHPDENRHAPATLQSQNRQRERQESTRRHAPYVSFGDRGITASAGAYGQLLRICRPIQDRQRGQLHSGLIGLGPAEESEAWYIHGRASEFLENSRVSARGIGLRILNSPSSEPPTVEFLEDRWPIISYRTKAGVTITVSLWCHNGLVVQQMQAINTLNTGEHLQLELNADFSLQDLDYQKKREKLQVRQASGPHGFGVVTLEDSPDYPIDQERICVLLGLFKDGKPQKTLFDKDEEDPYIKPSSLTFRHEFEGPNVVEFTVAIKIQMSTSSAQWQSFLIQPDDLIFDSQVEKAEDQNASLSNDRVLNWHFRRNLEHILSVCSIPLDSSLFKSQATSGLAGTKNEDPMTKTIKILGIDADETYLEHNDEPVDETEHLTGPMIKLQTPDGEEHVLHRSAPSQDRIGPVALTCGDFGDHRISVSGSYFAFMFMLEMYPRLSRTPKLRKRIYSTCKGHLEWVSKLCLEEACSSNIGIHGKKMDDRSGDTELPPNNPTNIPGHILKALQYLTVFHDTEDLLFVCSWLGGFALKWFRKLAQDKNPLTPTWQHLDDSEIPLYRLSDHVWIWKAFEGIEQLIQHVENTQSKMPHKTWEEFLRITRHLPHRATRKFSDDFILDFTAEEIRQQNLGRFSVENDILKKRMLSVTRSARETRFLLHSRDTVLYYGLDWGFFSGAKLVWEQLAKAQTQHNEVNNDEPQWDNPLRYGLAIEMAKEGHRLERTLAPVEMFDHAQDIILKSSSENGLFPGQLDDFSKEPALFDRELFRDFYFHVGFEIPYILLRTIEQPGQQISEMPPKTPGQRRPRSETRESPVQRKRELSPMPEPVVGTVPGYVNTQDGRAFATQRTLKQLTPYGRIADLSNIVDVPEEWIYRQQDFLSFIPPADQPTLDLLQSEAPSEIKKAMEQYLFRNAIDRTVTNVPPRGNCHVSISDVRKDRKERKWSVEERSATYSILTYKELWFRLQKRRNAEYSKKRLIYLRSPDYIVASLCYVASPELERGNVAQFFDRHAKVHANWLYDDTAAVLNSWITEVHFRFFQVMSADVGEIPSQEPTPIRQIKSQRCGISGDNAYLVDAIISFRISGDFFDRYWTCYVAQQFANPKDLESPLISDLLDQTAHWQQRKVLELILMNLVLEKVSTSTSLILRRIQRGAGNKTSDVEEKYFSKDSFEDRKLGELRECFQLLAILQDNIASLQSLIEQWNSRESSRGRERPRWTRSDEQKYRKLINQKTAQFEDQNRRIKGIAATIEFLIVLVTNAQHAIRAEKSLREAENITLFTYVTVFFLPVGLAVSVFGMNGIPDRTTIVSMLVTAAVALLITVGVLWLVLSHLISFGFRSAFSVFKTRTSLQRPVDFDGGGPQEEYPNQRIRRRLSLAYNSPSKLRKYDRDLEGQLELTRKERLSTSDERSSE